MAFNDLLPQRYVSPDRRGASVWHSWHRLVLGAFATGMVLCSGARAQRVVETSREIVCNGCRIQTGTPIPLRGAFESGSLEGVAKAIRRSPDGRFFVVAGSVVDVYSAAGVVSPTSVGRVGSGPGEFRSIQNILVSGSSLHVYDARLRRRTDFDLRTGAVIRTVPLPRHLESIVFPDGRTVVTGPVPTREASGQPLHVYGPNGTWERSFGLEEAFLRPDLELLLYYSVYPATPSTFWAVPRNEHRIELWDLNGRLLRTLQGGRPWFQPWTVPRPASPDHPPQPAVVDLVLDSAGLMWVISALPGERWADAVIRHPGGMFALSTRGSSPQYRVPLLEVIDPATGERLAELRLAHHNIGLAAPGYLWRSWTDDDDLPRAEIIPFSLVGR